MKTGYKSIQAAVMAVVILASAPPSAGAQAPAAGPKMKMAVGQIAPEYLVVRSDVIADMGLKVPKGANGKAVLDSLTPEQRKRLDEISLQMMGVSSLRNPEVQAKLKMSTEQADALERIADDSMKEFTRLHESDLDAEAMSKAFGVRRNKTHDDSFAVLTPAQHAAWQAMTGKPFKMDMNLGMSISSQGSTAAPPVKEEPLLSAGIPAPDFEARTVDGKAVRLSDYRGKVVVLDFWATWCGPCIASLPGLEETARRTKGQDVVFLALNVWDAEREFKNWLGINTELTLNFVRDPAGESRESKGIASMYNVNGIPTTYVIDRDGKVVGTPQPEPLSSSMGGKRRPIPTSGKLPKELVEMLGRNGIKVM